MRWEQLFLDHGRVRPSWRFFLALVMIVFAYLAVGIILGMAFGLFHRHPQHLLFWANCLMLLALLAIFKMLTRFFEEKPLSSIGLAVCGRWKTELGIGLSLGVAMILAVAGLEWSLGLARFSLNTISAEQVLAAGGYYGFLFAVAAVNEEIIFRGYPFQRLVEVIGPASAVAILSIGFGLIHLQNPSHTWLSTLNTVAIGISLSVAYLRTRALWLPIGLHFAWNFVLGYVFGLPVSGILFSKSLFTSNVHGPAWLTGGNYGPEGSGLAACVILAATIYLLFSRRIYISEETRGLTLDASNSSPAQLAGGEASPVASTNSL
ncbi:MAG: CPBP family intramembrane glutamic endopeptidase [Terriglobia bacterium]